MDFDVFDVKEHADKLEQPEMVVNGHTFSAITLENIPNGYIPDMILGMVWGKNIDLLKFSYYDVPGTIWDHFSALNATLSGTIRHYPAEWFSLKC